METPEAFAVAYLEALDRDEQPQLAKRIEARDAAVALAVLDSVENRIREQFIRKRSGAEWRQILPILIREQRAKFAPEKQ